MAERSAGTSSAAAADAGAAPEHAAAGLAEDGDAGSLYAKLVSWHPAERNMA